MDHLCNMLEKWELQCVMSTSKHQDHLNMRMLMLSAEIANHILVLLLLSIGEHIDYIIIS